jgi:hypothetical protein
MSDLLPEEQQFFDEAVERLKHTRRTFTERTALKAAWEENYELSLEFDDRFVKAQPRQGQYDPHYRLREHRLANLRLFNDLVEERWDGYDLDGRLVALDEEEGGHHVFYPHDPRLVRNHQGRWEAAVEKNIALTTEQKNELNTYFAGLLQAWQNAGSEPWTLARVIAALKQLGWPGAEGSDVVRVVRAWLLSAEQIVRVGQDFWVPANQLPAPVTRTRLHVPPVRPAHAPETRDQASPAAEAFPPTEHDEPLAPRSADPLIEGEVAAMRASWTATLLTVNILEGFFPVPSSVRAAYPPAAPGATTQTLLDALWYEDGEHFWLWLDREHHRLYGPGLLEKMAWNTPGDRLRIEWISDSVTISPAGHNEQVQREETRLIDVEALKKLRGSLGESYRQSLQEILAAAPDGLTWREAVEALSERQQHPVSRRTVLALLYKGGFLQRLSRWFAAPDNTTGQRSLRSALALLPQVEAAEHPEGTNEYVRVHAQAIKQRLEEISHMLSYR